MEKSGRERESAREALVPGNISGGIMEIEKRKMSSNYVLFSVKGELTLKTGKDFLEPVIREIAGGKSTQVGIDISRVKYIDSFGIGCILKCNNAMQQRSGVVGEIILILTERLRGKLAVVGLDRVLKCQVVPDHAPARSRSNENASRESGEKEDESEESETSSQK
jgi:anti-anti-sigma factor